MNFSLLNSQFLNFPWWIWGFVFPDFLLSVLNCAIFLLPLLKHNLYWICLCQYDYRTNQNQGNIKHQCFYLAWAVQFFLMLISTLFFFSSRETAVLLQVMFRLSFVLNVPILFSTIGCKISTTSFLMFIACVWDVFAGFFFNFEITC